MRAGRYRHRFTLLRATATENSGRGDRTKAWTTLATVQGEIVALAGEEQDLAQRIVAGVTHQFALRWARAIAAMTPQDLRIRWQGKTLEVHVLRDALGDHRELTGLAKEQPA